MQPIKLEGDTSILTNNHNSRLEPVIRTGGHMSMSDLRNGGPAGDFDYNQSKLYFAMKQH